MAGNARQTVMYDEYVYIHMYVCVINQTKNYAKLCKNCEQTMLKKKVREMSATAADTGNSVLNDK